MALARRTRASHRRALSDRRGHAYAAALALTLALLALASDATAAPLGAVVEFGLPNAAGEPFGIAPGPDGNLWVADFRGNEIARLTPAGEAVEFPISTAESKPTGIALGPGGNMWFVEYGAGKVGRITPAGSITEFPIPAGEKSGPYRIALGPDDNLWFVEEKADKIGRITPTGTISEFTVPTKDSKPAGIAPGADGNLWFTERKGNRIGRISTTGTLAEFPLPTAESEPEDIVAGPDGNLWFTELKKNEIGRVTPAGVVTEFPVPTASASPEWLTAAPDGNLWFTESSGNKIARISPAGAINEYEVPTAKSTPTGIAAGSDGNVWFAEFGVGRVGRVGTEAAPALAAAPAVSGGALAGIPQRCIAPVWTSWLAQQPSATLFPFDGYRWLLDGSIVGAGASYTPTVAGIGHHLACAQTVTYASPLFISAVATSPQLTVGRPPRPVITRLRQSARRWRRGRHLARVGANRARGVGTTFSFSLNEPATVSFDFTRPAAGRRVGRRCLTPTPHNARRKPCTRRRTIATLAFNGHSSRNRVVFEGRVSRLRRLKPGRYTLVVHARNAVGARSAPVAISFTIVR
jgi:streptogramin lyase